MHGVIAGKTEQSGFVPTMFGSGCVLWLTARTGVAVSGGTNVASWADQSVHGNNAVTFGDAPTYETSGAHRINGQPALRFGFNGGGNTELDIADDASLKPADAISLSCVARFSDIDFYQCVFVKTNNPSITVDGWGMVNPQPSTNKQGIFVDNVGTTFAYSSVSLETDYILTGIFTGSSINYYVNGSLAQSTPRTDPIGYNGASILRIGYADTYNRLAGILSEVVVCNFALDTSQRQQLERGYFGRIYGIST